MDIPGRIISIFTFIVMWDVISRLLADRRAAFLSASVLWATWAVAITEGLSIFWALTYWAVLGAWGLALSVALGAWFKIVKSPQHAWKDFAPIELPRSDWIIAAGAVFIVSAAGVIALIAPPNTYDAMTYHMSRVLHWIQNGSVAYYPTHILRQIYMTAGAEYLLLQFQILGGSDRLANSVQWFSMLGSVLGVSLSAKQLGADRRGQLFSSVAAVTIPMGILQASSTQTDYVTAFWLVCFVYFLFALRNQGRLWQALGCGASLGLALLTKATSYVYALVFLIWFVVLMLRKYRALYGPGRLGISIVGAAAARRGEGRAHRICERGKHIQNRIRSVSGISSLRHPDARSRAGGRPASSGRDLLQGANIRLCFGPFPRSEERRTAPRFSALTTREPCGNILRLLPGR